MRDRDPRDKLPPHIEDSVRSIARLHGEHHRAASPGQRAADHITAVLGQGRSLTVLSVLLAGWIGANLLASATGRAVFDPPPFHWLAGVIAIVNLYLVILILASEQRENRLAERRAQLTLELAVLGERKTAKVIELLEAMRRESRALPDRHDPEATAMARPADPETVIAAIDATHARAAEPDRPAT